MKSSAFLLREETVPETVGDGVVRRVMGYDGRLMLVEAAFETGSVGATHAHPHSQSSYIAAGRFEVTVGDRTQTLTAGEGFYVEPNAPHGVLCLERGTIVDAFAPAREDFL